MSVFLIVPRSVPFSIVNRALLRCGKVRRKVIIPADASDLASAAASSPATRRKRSPELGFTGASGCFLLQLCHPRLMHVGEEGDGGPAGGTRGPWCFYCDETRERSRVRTEVDCRFRFPALRDAFNFSVFGRRGRLISFPSTRERLIDVRFLNETIDREAFRLARRA